MPRTDLDVRSSLFKRRPVSQMRELERDSTSDNSARKLLAVIGQGRVGHAFAAHSNRRATTSPARSAAGPTSKAPTSSFCACPTVRSPGAAALLHPGPDRLVGHCSGATGLDVLAPHEAFSLHPLMTVTAQGALFAGAGAAIAADTPRGLALAGELARALGMRPVEIAERDRPAYHAAASIASNFLVTLEAAAERVGAAVGIERELLVPLVRATVENWASLGPERALTGPVARGDEATVTRQRAAVQEVAADLLPLFDTLVQATRALASIGSSESPAAREAQPA